MKRLFTALTLTFVLAGCSVLSSTEQRIQAACAGITSTMQVLTFNQDRLTAGQKAAVVRALDHAYPVCGQGEAPTADKVKLAALLAVQNELTKLADEVRK